jgi:hypothetical protein
MQSLILCLAVCSTEAPQPLLFLYAGVAGEGLGNTAITRLLAASPP